MKRILVIQTAFIGDAILATALLEKVHATYPEAAIDLVIRKGNEALFTQHPFLNHVFIWNKKNGKYRSLFRLSGEIRKQRYDAVVNVQRFASSGFLAWRARATWKSGFSQNPFAFVYKHKVRHTTSNGLHETRRNQQLIAPITDETAMRPALYPTPEQFNTVRAFQTLPYYTIAPASVWHTKQLPATKWLELIATLPAFAPVFLLGGPDDVDLCEQIRIQSKQPNVHTAAGKLSLLETAAFMKGAIMNYSNDSAPMHLASAMNAPVTAVYCSTVPAFGFGPLSDQHHIIETTEKLDCRPCGLHGKRECPKGHFRCASTIRF
jgi:heptosyltransferase-2